MPLQQSCEFSKQVTVKLDYLLYLPDGYDKEASKQWPLLIFLHGAGERGNDLNLVTKHGPPRLIKEGKHFPFIVASPQCPTGQWWSTDSLILFLEHLETKYRIDPQREYLTGISMGGFGTWSLAILLPDKFAAIAPICGFGEPFLTGAIRNVPTWVFHGAKDDVVPLSRSEDMVNALKKAGGNVKFTVYPEANHDSWTDTYNNPELYEWFLANKKADK